MARATTAIARRPDPKFVAVRRDVARSRVPAERAAALRGLRSFRHARQFSLLGPLSTARRACAPPGLVRPHEQDQSRSFFVKNYILDTNVLLHDPNSILSFQDNNVLIPIEVIEEIDRFKRESTERGANARTVSRTLDGLRNQGRLSEGVSLSTGGRLRIIFQNRNGDGHVTFGDNTVDSRIVALALEIKKAEPKNPT